MTSTGCTQDIAILPLECNARTPTRSGGGTTCLISNVVGEQWRRGARHLRARDPAERRHALADLGRLHLQEHEVHELRQRLADLHRHGRLHVRRLRDRQHRHRSQGFVPYAIDPDLLDADGKPMFLENRSSFRNFKGSTMTRPGAEALLVRQSRIRPQALRDAITFLNCADIDIGTVRVRYPNRINDPIANGALSSTSSASAAASDPSRSSRTTMTCTPWGSGRRASTASTWCG